MHISMGTKSHKTSHGYSILFFLLIVNILSKNLELKFSKNFVQFNGFVYFFHFFARISVFLYRIFRYISIVYFCLHFYLYKLIPTSYHPKHIMHALAKIYGKIKFFHIISTQFIIKETLSLDTYFFYI